MSKKLDQLKDKLREMFQMDQADLDFGIYRIMNAKRDEVERFLDADLLPTVRATLEKFQPTGFAEKQKELEEAIAAARKLKVDPDTVEDIQRMKAELASAASIDQLEEEVYSHLATFFARYYQGGDFMSLRRYKEGVYALPYEGEEVKLHWANADQYYIKSAENFRTYAFKAGAEGDQRRVRFELTAADTERDNNKAAADKERRFILFAAEPLALDGDELVIRFEYRPDADKRSQKDLNAEAVAALLALPEGAPATNGIDGWLSLRDALATKQPTEKNPNRTTLERHLTDYTAKNSFDYFIHKNLGAFLRRELDFFIKNEVMFLDDIEEDSAPRVEQYLAKIKALRQIAHKIIDFLAQLEDFQKKLWLKKKLVLETNWLVTLDKVPVGLYPAIIANDAQRAEWVRLFAIDEIKGDLGAVGYSDPLTETFLKANPFLVLDTAFFDQKFKDELLEQFDDLDAETAGLLVHGENSQALNLLTERYRDQVSSIYIDPPYNTDAAPIAYKNGYKDSSWLSLLADRVRVASLVMNNASVMCITIDDVELHLLRSLMESVLPAYELLGVAAIKNNPAGRTGTVGFSVCHEYGLFYGLPETSRVGRLEHSDAQKARYKERDELGAFEWTNFRKHGGENTYRPKRPRQYYPIYVSGSAIRIPEMEWDNDARDWNVLQPPLEGEEVLYPIDSNGRERIWDFVASTAIENMAHLAVRKDENGKTAVYRKWRINDDGLLPPSWWEKSKYSAVEYGTNLLAKIFGKTHAFTFPKSVHAVEDALRVCGAWKNREALVLDFFAGSGTTGHAVSNFNRIDDGLRKFLLAEMGTYFDEVLKSRMAKIAYSSEWNGGKPLARDGRSTLIKYIRLESYEDALDNLALNRSAKQNALLDRPDAKEFREDYVLRYMLDVESRASLLNLARFEDPFNVTMTITRNDETKAVTVDLVETFNYLLGLRVKTTERVRGILEIIGVNPDGERVLVLWRNVHQTDNDALDQWFDKRGYRSRDMEFDLIYVNGDNNIPNLRLTDETWKVRLIEEAFHELMFDVRDV